jgi:hypothetical protein
LKIRLESHPKPKAIGEQRIDRNGDDNGRFLRTPERSLNGEVLATADDRT